MAEMTPSRKRRIRIEGKPDELCGYLLRVFDADTGEPITNIKSIAIRLSAEHDNEADITYYDKATLPGEPGEQRTITLKNPEIAITAYDTKPSNGQP